MTRENAVMRNPKEVAPRFARRFYPTGPWQTRKIPLGTLRYRKRRRPEFVEMDVAVGQLGHAIRNGLLPLIRRFNRLLLKVGFR